MKNLMKVLLFVALFAAIFAKPLKPDQTKPKFGGEKIKKGNKVPEILTTTTTTPSSNGPIISSANVPLDPPTVGISDWIRASLIGAGK
jgi:hypothetical protein